jgi:hypothetical protein
MRSSSCVVTDNSRTRQLINLRFESSRENAVVLGSRLDDGTSKADSCAIRSDAKALMSLVRGGGDATGNVREVLATKALGPDREDRIVISAATVGSAAEVSTTSP